MNKPQTLRFILMLAISSFLPSMIVGCTPGIHGTVIEPDQRAAIVRGATTKDQLLKLLGEPDQAANLGGGRERLSYIHEIVANRSNIVIWGNSTKSEFWIVLRNNVVEAYGDSATNVNPSYMKWLF